MSQNVVDFSGDPSGVELLDSLLTPLQENVISTHIGTSRPSYAVAGTVWIDNTTTPWDVNIFDGTDDITIGNLDATANTFVLNPAFTQTFPAIRLVDTANLAPSATTGSYSLDAWDTVGSAFRKMVTVLSGAVQSMTLAASAAAVEPLIVPHGSAPSSPTNGSLWTTTGGLFARINGATEQYAKLASPTFTGTLTAATVVGTSFQVGASSTPASSNVVGLAYNTSGVFHTSRDGGVPALINRKTNDGDILAFYQDGTQEGSVSSSGTTVTYNAFLGSHWAQFKDGSKKELLRGTILETIDELCEWKQGVWVNPITGAEQKDVCSVAKDVGETFEEKTLVLAAHEKEVKRKVKVETEKLVKGKKVKSAEEQEVTDIIKVPDEYRNIKKTVVAENNDRLPKVRVSDTKKSRSVYGVFLGWDRDCETSNDMHVAAIGAGFVRIAKGTKVERGDLLVSAGNGCAIVQDDDLIRSSTIGKVSAAVTIETYDDGSYLVPTVLMCG